MFSQRIARDKPGVYRATFTASGTLSNGTVVVSEPVQYTFCVENVPIPLAQPALNITQPLVGQVTVSWPGESGATYQLQSKTVLSDVWMNEGAPITGACGTHSIAFPVPNGSAKFFRIEVEHAPL